MPATSRRPLSSAVASSGSRWRRTSSAAGLAVTVVELADQVLAPLDPELAVLVAEELGRHGVKVVLGTALAKVLPDAVELTDGQVVARRRRGAGHRGAARDRPGSGGRPGHRPPGWDPCRRIAVYVRPAHLCGWRRGRKTDQVNGEPVLVPLANLANRQGRMVADQIAGRPRAFPTVQGTAIVKVFGKVAAVTGWNEKRLRSAGRPFMAIHAHLALTLATTREPNRWRSSCLVDPASHAILGAQAVGGSGVDKRIDVLATAIHAGLPAPELVDLELGYAPQFGSAKDPINLLGYIAENRLHRNESSVQWHELPERVAAGTGLIDARTPAEYAAGHIPGAANVPLDELRELQSELGQLAPPGSKLIVYCQVGRRAHTAARLLMSWGYNVANLDGGYLTWSAATRAEQAAGKPAGL